MVGQFIDTFWRKSFLGDLRRARRAFEDESQWILEYQGREHRFHFVWIQGLCTKVDRAEDTMTIEDATGQAILQNCSSVPDALSANEGDYLIVGGKLTDAAPAVRIYPYKVQGSSSGTKHELLWPAEVIDISQRVYFQI